MTKHTLLNLGGLKHCGLVAAVWLLAAAAALAQNTQPVWYPPLSLYGRPVAQPFFDFPVWARYCSCRPAPLAWGYDPFPNYGPGQCDNCQGPASINCPGGFVCHRPSIWYASADLAPLARVYPNTSLARRFVPSTPGVNLNADTDFVDPGEVPPTPPFFTGSVFDTHDLQSEYDAGGKFTVGAHVLGCLRVEGTYLGAYAWNTSAGLHDPSADLATMFSGFLIPQPQTPPPPTPFAGATDVNLFSQTRLQSAEANVRYWVDMPPGPFDVSLLVGARYMRIDDSMRFLATNGLAGPNNDVTAATQNTLWGVQVGIAGDWMIHPRFWINTDLKFGLYDDQSSLVRTLNGVNRQGDGRSTAFVGDLSFVGHWQMTPWLVFNIGYQLLIVDGIATGIDNIQQPLFPPNPPPGLGPQTNYDKTGQITFHGPVIGLMAVW